MKRQRIYQLIVIICGSVAIFAAVQLVGSYLIEEMASYRAGESEKEPLERIILRIDTAECYSFVLAGYSDTAAAQALVDDLAVKGYRLAVSSEAPYRLYLGCWGKEPAQEALPAEISDLCSDIYPTKILLNSVSFKYTAGDSLREKRIAPFIAAVDVLVKKSLDMFGAVGYSSYRDSDWQEMTAALSAECSTLETELEALVLSAEPKPAAALDKFAPYLADYRQSLGLIATYRSDKAIFMAQSYLLDLIFAYHQLLAAASG